MVIKRAQTCSILKLSFSGRKWRRGDLLQDAGKVAEDVVGPSVFSMFVFIFWVQDRGRGRPFIDAPPTENERIFADAGELNDRMHNSVEGTRQGDN